MSDRVGAGMNRYRCSACGEEWLMDDLPVACPYCGGDIIGGYREIVTREVGVEDAEPDSDEVLPEFEELIEG